jgi:hypothetical protein
MPFVKYETRKEKGAIAMTENVRKFEKDLRGNEKLQKKLF